eukprot:246210_1
MEAMDEWIDKIAKSRSNISPNEIPWDALHKMLVQFVYGGRVDNKYDTSRLTSFVENLFSPEAFNDKFSLSSLCEAVDDEKDSYCVGRLGYVCPIVDGKKQEKEMLARVVTNSGDGKVKVVYSIRYVVIGKERINLNLTDNWIQTSEFRLQRNQMRPVIILPEKTKYQDIRNWVLQVDDVTL